MSRSPSRCTRATSTSRSRRWFAKFLAMHPGEVDGACFGIGGPVRNGRVQEHEPGLARRRAGPRHGCSGSTGALLNDLEANAWGLVALGAGRLRGAQRGRSGATGNVAVCSAGTGLGEAGLYWDGERPPSLRRRGRPHGLRPATSAGRAWRFLAASTPTSATSGSAPGIGAREHLSLPDRRPASSKWPRSRGIALARSEDARPLCRRSTDGRQSTVPRPGTSRSS